MSNEMMTLKATKREFGTKGAARRTRAGGLIPAVVYGTHVDNVPVAVDPKEIEACLRTEYGFNAVFQLDVEGGESLRVMVKDYQFHGVRRELTHLDFIVVTGDDKVTIHVPVEAVGKSAGVVMGGRLDIVARTVKIRCTVETIPATIQHDITPLEIADSVYIDEMVAPDGIEFVFDNRFPVIRIARKRGPKEDTTTTTAAGVVGEDAEGEEGEGEEGAEGEAVDA